MSKIKDYTGFFNKLGLVRDPPRNNNPVPSMNGFSNNYLQFGDSIYLDVSVRQAVNCIAEEISKLQPKHVRGTREDLRPVHGPIQKVLDFPNPWMTKSDFLEKIVFILEANRNAFVVPVWDRRRLQDGTLERTLRALYPVLPRGVTFIQDASNSLFVKFSFMNGLETTFPYDDIIHLRKEFNRNDFMGGSLYGMPENEALLRRLKLNDSLLSGVQKGLESSFAINGLLKYNTFLDGDDMQADLDKFNQQLQQNASGILGTDIKNDLTMFQRKVQMVDPATLQFIDNQILRNFGVSTSILNGDFTKAQYEAFFQKTLEPIINKLNQTFSKVLLTPQERAHGNQINFYHGDLVFMTNLEKLQMVRLLGDAGSIFENEKRVVFGFSPLAELAGVRQKSLNYVDVEIANEYQMTNAGSQSTGLKAPSEPHESLSETDESENGDETLTIRN